jgi:hypothetical protein
MIALPASVLLALMLVLQYVTLAKFAVLPPSLSFLSLAEFRRITEEHVVFDLLDLVLVLLCALCVGWIIAAEARRRAVTAALAWLGTSDMRALLGLLAISLVAVRYYFGTGVLSWAADAPQHITYTNIVSQALRAGLWPWWTYYLGTGSPFLQFYGFLFFLLAGGISVALPTTIGLKLCLGVLHALSGSGVYVLLRGARRRRTAALAGGLAYVLCFWHTQQVLIMGRLPLALVYLLLPWALAGFQLSICQPQVRWRWVLAGGCALGGVTLTHPGYGLWSCAFCCLYILLHLRRNNVVHHGLPGLVLLGSGFTISMALLLPMWLDQHATGLATTFTLAGVPDPTWWSLVNWSNFRFFLFPPEAAQYNWYGGYLGISLLTLALSGLATPVRLRRNALPACLCLAAALLLALAYSSWLIQALPGVFLLAGGRYLLFAVLFLAIAVGHGVHALQVTQRARSRRVATLVLGLIAVDLGPTTFQQPYGRLTERGPDGFLIREFDELRARAAVFADRGEVPNGRAFFARGQANRYLASGVLYDQAHMPIPNGPHPGELAAVFDFVEPLERYVSWWVQQNPATSVEVTDDVILAGLRLLNTRFLLWALPGPEGQQLTTVELPQPTPVLAAGSARPFDAFLADRPQVEQLLATQTSQRLADIVRVLALIRGMDVDSAGSTCGTIFLRGLQTPRDLGTTPEVLVRRHTVTEERVELDITLSQDGFVRLAYGYWPHTVVLVDGAEVQPWETEGRFTALELDAGDHLIVLQPRLSALRQTLIWLVLVISLATVCGFLYHRRFSPSNPIVGPA